jgi:hypothetical protein
VLSSDELSHIRRTFITMSSHRVEVTSETGGFAQRVLHYGGNVLATFSGALGVHVESRTYVLVA